MQGVLPWLVALLVVASLLPASSTAWPVSAGAALQAPLSSPVAALSSPVAALSCLLVFLLPSPARTGRCFTEIEQKKPKVFYYSRTPSQLTILAGEGAESRLIATTFQLFAREVLGYRFTLVPGDRLPDDHMPVDLLSGDRLPDDTDNDTDTMVLGDRLPSGNSSPALPALEYPNNRLAQLSSCESMRCHSVNIKTDAGTPPAMMTLDLWLPPSYVLDSWDVLDSGQLGPATRYGWFMPSRPLGDLGDVRDMGNHWRILTQSKYAQEFQPSSQDWQYVQQRLKDRAGRFHCRESYCHEGVFTPPACGARHRHCGLLLAAAPGISQMYNSSLVIRQILEEKLLVKVAFVGPSLEEVVQHLEDSGSSYLVLHFTPSVLVLRHGLLPLLFPPCQDPLLQRNRGDPACYYAANRLAKVVWTHLQTAASELYTFIQAFGFGSYKEYVDLLQLHVDSGNSSSAADYEATVCRWLRQELPPVSLADNTTLIRMRYQDKLAKLQPAEKPKLFIGGIFPITGTKYKAPELAAVAMIAVNDVNNSPGILPNHKLSLDINDGQCEADVVMKRFIDIIKTNDASKFRSTVGMLGPACSDTVEPIAGVSKHFRTVVISYSAEGTISNGNSKEYPYFFRTIAENKQYKYAYIQTMKRLGWRKVAALTQDGQKYSDYMPALQDEFQANHFEFMENRKFPEEVVDVEKMKEYLEGLKEKGAKVIIGEFYVTSARIVMCTAFKLEMTQREGYVWFLPGWFERNWYDVDSLKLEKAKQQKAGVEDNSEGQGFQMGSEGVNIGALPDCTTQEMLQAINGHLSLIHEHLANDDVLTEDGRTVMQWKMDLAEEMTKIVKAKQINKPVAPQISMVNESVDVDFNLTGSYFNLTKPYTSTSEDLGLNKYSGYVYDAVWLYAKSLDTLVKQSNKSYIQNLHSPRTVQEFVSIINKMDFQGVSGRINFKGRNSRLSNIRIMQWRQPNNGSQWGWFEVGEYEPNYEKDPNSQDNSTNGRLTEWDVNAIVWQTADGKKPLDNPKECGILSSFATNLDIECQLAITIAFIIGFAVLLLNLFIVLLVFKRRYEMKMKATEERMRALGLLTPMSVLTLDEWEIPRDRVVINRRLGEGAFGAVYGGESFFDEKGWVAVAVKTLKAGSTVDEKIDFLSEAEMMKRFDHRNIVKLLGVCTRNEPVYMVMEFMLYGDLKTYLLARRHLVNERNREELDEVSNKRLTSMAYDIAKGLEYLAEQKYVHRDIACRNCLVNSSRTVKLADFGMTRPMFESDYYRFSKKGMLPVRWMSPESLSDGLFTPMSDIWSFGVLLYEMITFGSFPFQGLSNNQVLVHVKAGNTLTVPQGIKSQMALLLRTCFSHTPTKRPTAGEIVELLLKHPRVVSPCIDVPLASVQIERTDSLEMMPKPRKESSQKNKPSHIKNKAKELSPEDQGYGSGTHSGAYSPMDGREGSAPQGLREPLLEPSSWEEEQRVAEANSSYHGSPEGSPYTPGQVGSYVPSGYIVLDHSQHLGGDYTSFSHSSI